MDLSVVRYTSQQAWSGFLAAELLVPMELVADCFMPTLACSRDYQWWHLPPNGHRQGPDELLKSDQRDHSRAWQCDRAVIPWILVHTVASQMLQATLRGFATQFSMQFRHTHGIVIEVVLQVLPAAVQATRSSP